MQFTIEKKELVNKLNKIKFAADGIVDFSLKGSKVFATTSNDEVEAETVILEASIPEHDCKYPVSAFIFNVIEKLPDGNIEFSFNEVRLTIKSINGEYILNYVNNTRFNFRSLKKDASRVITLENPNEIIRKSSISLSKGSNVSSGKNKMFTGINLNVTPDYIYVQSCDTFRLSQTKIKNLNNLLECNIVVTGNAFTKAIANINDHKINLYYDSNMLWIEANDTRYNIRLINDKYPDVNKFIPEASAFNKVVLNKNIIISALDRTSIFNENDNNYIKLKYDKNQKILEITKNSSIGNAAEEVKVIDGDSSFELAVNGMFLKEALRSFKSNEIELRIFGEYKPMLILSKDEPELTQLVLPVRI